MSEDEKKKPHSPAWCQERANATGAIVHVGCGGAVGRVSQECFKCGRKIGTGHSVAWPEDRERVGPLADRAALYSASPVVPEEPSVIMAQGYVVEQIGGNGYDNRPCVILARSDGEFGFDRIAIYCTEDDVKSFRRLVYERVRVTVSVVDDHADRRPELEEDEDAKRLAGLHQAEQEERRRISDRLRDIYRPEWLEDDEREDRSPEGSVE